MPIKLSREKRRKVHGLLQSAAVLRGLQWDVIREIQAEIGGSGKELGDFIDCLSLGLEAPMPKGSLEGFVGSPALYAEASRVVTPDRVDSLVSLVEGADFMDRLGRARRGL